MLYLLQQYFRLEEIQTSGEEKIKDDRILNILNYIQKSNKYRISLQELAEKEYRVLPSEYRKQNKPEVRTYEDDLSFSAQKRGSQPIRWQSWWAS